MNAADTVRLSRARAGLSLRELARRASTSHATLRAYETGAKEPRVETLDRIVSAAGFALEVDLSPRPDAGPGREAKGRELVEALTLAAAFPTRPRSVWRAPVFGRAS